MNWNRWKGLKVQNNKLNEGRKDRSEKNDFIGFGGKKSRAIWKMSAYLK